MAERQRRNDESNLSRARLPGHGLRSHVGPRIRVGVSGWRYAPWRGVFYPQDLPQRLELRYAATIFPTIEINGSFYSLQRPESWLQWYAETPEQFVFSVKGPRFITHMLRLRGVEQPLANFLASGVLALKEKLGPILWQFPPTLRFDAGRFDAFLALLPRNTAAALQLARRRHPRMHGRSHLAIDKPRALREVGRRADRSRAAADAGGWTYGALVNHIWSFAGDDDRSDISSTFLQPFLAKQFSGGRTITLNSESSYDWKGENWNVPLNLGYSKVTKWGSQMLSWQAGVRYFVETPGEGPDWGLRATLTLLFPGR